MSTADDLVTIWTAGVDAVIGRRAVCDALRQHNVMRPDAVIAVGKAAASMAAAAHDAFGPLPMLIVTKHGHVNDAPQNAEIIEAAHPVPDAQSLKAGARLIDAVDNMAQDTHLLVLTSGGASALAEHLVDGLSLGDLADRTQALLASGQDIHAINALRKDLSAIKGGKLLARFKGQRITSLAISDVEGDALGVIGSGIGDAPADTPFDFAPYIVASNAIARAAAAHAAPGVVLSNTEDLYDDVVALAPRIAAQVLAAGPGLHIKGGEPTVILPPNPGKGGRNMALALLLAREIAGIEGVQILVAGTDGTDGPTDAAGALVDGHTWDVSGSEALNTANAAPWLDARGALFRSGPTGTNVMDILIAKRT
ncbi:DUF4147 domain-containing protein [Ascidiaceihabitans sp.]|uniref:DUF4147 domain-containing protein n=1 Tax=Ascidiaceihabitans sp. TaxID=1872644 RepID=UPI0032993448